MDHDRPGVSSAASGGPPARFERWAALDRLADATAAEGRPLLVEVHQELIRQLPAGEQWGVDLAWRLAGGGDEPQWRVEICSHDQTRSWFAAGYAPGEVLQEVRTRIWPAAKAMLWRREDEAAERRAARDREDRPA